MFLWWFVFWAHLIVLFKAVVYRRYCFYLEMSVGLLPTIVIS